MLPLLAHVLLRRLCCRLPGQTSAFLVTDLGNYSHRSYCSGFAWQKEKCVVQARSHRVLFVFAEKVSSRRGNIKTDKKTMTSPRPLKGFKATSDVGDDRATTWLCGLLDWLDDIVVILVVPLFLSLVIVEFAFKLRFVILTIVPMVYGSIKLLRADNF